MKIGAYMILSLLDCWVLLNLSKTTNRKTPNQVGISSAIRLAEITEILMSWMENQERALLSRIRQEFYKTSRSGGQDFVTDLCMVDREMCSGLQCPGGHRIGFSWVLLNSASLQKLPMISFLNLCLDFLKYLRNKGDTELKQKNLNGEGLKFGRGLDLFKSEIKKLPKIYTLNHWKQNTG